MYGISGTLAYTAANQAHQIGPGDVLCIPRGVVHHFANTGTEAVSVLIVLSPAGLGSGYVHEVAALLADVDGGQPGRAMGEIMRRHGLSPAPPPGA